ncbi:hypothetical protein IQ17_03914 [Bradyrhizobium daqingense]|uniref:Uncharacterized protein n=1 Tax=Bradyrhizobium daqingense TaxID=993502 RepID=A0A562L8Q7_9BRAD|nr:hypothetical protein IQ17_03914 [Bradyrhizobium daqingense]
MLLNKRFRNASETYPSERRGYQSDGIVGHESPLRFQSNDLVTIHCQPCLGSLHSNFVCDELFWCCRRTVFQNVVRARYIFCGDPPHSSGKQIGVREVTNPDCAVEPFRNQVNKLIGKTSLNVKLWVALS